MNKRLLFIILSQRLLEAFVFNSKNVMFSGNMKTQHKVKFISQYFMWGTFGSIFCPTPVIYELKNGNKTLHTYRQSIFYEGDVC